MSDEKKLHSEQIEAFKKLGLTSSQTKVYVILTKLGPASVREIAYAANVDRANLYRTISRLIKKGLVQKIIDVPTKYSALPLRNALKVLLISKTQEFNEIERITEKAIQHWEIRNWKINHQKEIEEQFTLLPPNPGHFQIFAEVFNNMQKSYDCTIDSLSIRNLLIADPTHTIRNLVKKGVKFRCLVGLLENKSSLEADTISVIKEMNELKGFFDIRYTAGPPKAVFGIIDDKEVFIHTKPAPNWVDSPSLRSSNSCLLAITKGYFEETWRKAKKHSTHLTKQTQDAD